MPYYKLIRFPSYRRTRGKQGEMLYAFKSVKCEIFPTDNKVINKNVSPLLQMRVYSKGCLRILDTLYVFILKH